MVSFTPHRHDDRSSPDRRNSKFEFKNSKFQYTKNAATKMAGGAAHEGKIKQLVCHYINLGFFLLLIVALVARWKKNASPGASYEGLVPERKALSRPSLPARPAASSQGSKASIQVVFVVGVEGTGHHGFNPLIIESARASGHRVMIGGAGPGGKHATETDRKLRTLLLNRDGEAAVTLIKETAEAAAEQNQGLLVLFKGSFPGRKNLRGDCIWENKNCMEEIKKFPLYDLEWLIKLVRPISTSVKAFWLFRNFPNLVASHSTWDGGFRKHAQVMATYLEYIAHTMPHFIPRNDWVRIDYEHVDSDIAPVMRSLGAFLGWKAEWQQVAKGITIQQSSRNATATLPQEKLDYVQTLVANFTKTKRWSQAVFDTTQRLLKRYPA